VGVCVSYTATLKLVGEVSQIHEVPLQQWIKDDVIFKFWGDNVDKKRGVRDVRSDNQATMLHMYSLLVGRSRIPGIGLSRTGQVAKLSSLPSESFLPTQSDVNATKQNLVVLVSRILTRYMHSLFPLSKAIPQHITHKYTAQMSKKSEVVVLDVLMKNEAKSSDMIDIMKKMQQYLGEGYPKDRRVASGGDQLTCECQAGSQRHVMCGNTPEERLELLEPQCEDWHCMVCVLTVC